MGLVNEFNKIEDNNKEMRVVVDGIYNNKENSNKLGVFYETISWALNSPHKWGFH